MKSIVKPDWDIFKTKFSENPQKNFEWFCYLLFCKEYKKDIGIFRYKNQSGIETNPIEEGNEVIGWQAKFYDTTLSEHKTELIETINKSKRDYQNITKIIFYTNQEWGQGRKTKDLQTTLDTGEKKNDPQAKIDVEEIAKLKNIEVVWRTSSFFEAPFVTVNNKSLAQHFFTLDRSIISFLEDKRKHSESILNGIQSKIEFNGQRIEIDRENILETIQNEFKQKQIIIISGEGGVGKTAVIKKYYNYIISKVPCYIFKASEFNIVNINELFQEFCLSDFIETHKYEETKIAIIDSAEKLLELKFIDSFKEFLSCLIESNWKIIFTTRDNYLEDLNYQFLEIYKVVPTNVYIKKLTYEELKQLSIEYNFNLTSDIKLLDLIRNPFYLNEYLKEVKNNGIDGYLKFKDIIWKRVIKKAKPIREQCFLQIALKRAREGCFFVKCNFDYSILDELVESGILGYETSGYFINHDIYEEWALEKIINSEFFAGKSCLEFFESIGESLVIRRSFRKWLSEKLLFKDESVISFIEDMMQNNELKSFWQDEILVSILLSEYSKIFFEIFKEKLLQNNFELLKRVSFMLRIACKKLDDLKIEQLGTKDINLLSADLLLTKPNGYGWISFIDFVYNNLDIIGICNIKFILPVIYDWNNKYREGSSTKQSSLIALNYYKWIVKKDIYIEKEVKEKIFAIILYGANEIKRELSQMFDDIIKNNWRNYKDPYYDFIEVILSKWEYNCEVINSLPNYILKLASLYWNKDNNIESLYYNYGLDIDESFGLENKHEYFPASSFQTPIYWLLQVEFKKTVDFILLFTDLAVEKFSTSDIGKKEVKKIKLYLDEEIYTEQYVCDRLFNIYRGTKVAPDILKSIHMALEKYFLEIAKNTKDNILEKWLLYLLAHTKSTSITAIVISIVLAFPDKTFNVAKVLFRTKELFLYDSRRFILDRDAKFEYSIGYGLNFSYKIHEDERIKSCEDNHRKKRLEDIALYYQFFRSESISEEIGDERIKTMYNIIDKYYEELNNNSKNTEDNKIWRMCLARIDRRKMQPEVEECENGLLINFNPKLDDDLLEFSEASSSEYTEKTKYIELNLWASYRIKNNDEYKKYDKYEENPSLVIKEVKEILLELGEKSKEKYFLYNYSIPGNACSALIKYYLDKLTLEEKKFCKETILEVAMTSLNEGYKYQISDGVESSIYALPILLKEFSEEKEIIKLILLLTLFDDTPIGNYCRFSEYSIRTISSTLWNISYDDSKSILLGYLLLYPVYEEVENSVMKENCNYFEGISKDKIISKFIKENESKLKDIIDNIISAEDINGIENLNLYIKECIPIITFTIKS